MTSFISVLALSFHAVFEGLAVGLEEGTQDVWALFTGGMCIIFSREMDVENWYKMALVQAEWLECVCCVSNK